MHLGILLIFTTTLGVFGDQAILQVKPAECETSAPVLLDIGVEPNYVGFENDPKKLARVKQAVADAYLLAQSSVGQLFNEDAFRHYLSPGSNAIPRTQAMLRSIAVDGKGTAIMAEVSINYNDFADNCLEGRAAYMLYYKFGDSPQIHFCDLAFTFGDLQGPLAIKTTDIGDRMSMKMLSMGQILLHEFLHWDQVGKFIFSHHIGDIGTPASDDCYGPYNTRSLLDVNRRMENADSFAWYASETYWTARRDGRILDAPGPGDNKSPKCEPSSTCTIS